MEKTTVKQSLKKILLFIANPRLLLCFGIGWMITNGWAYILLAIGTWMRIHWMISVAGAYLAFLWLPISPEKLVTLAIAIALLRWLFPKDEKTLAVLRELYEKTKALLRRGRERHRAKKAARQAARLAKRLEKQAQKSRRAADDSIRRNEKN